MTGRGGTKNLTLVLLSVVAVMALLGAPIAGMKLMPVIKLSKPNVNRGVLKSVPKPTVDNNKPINSARAPRKRDSSDTITAHVRPSTKSQKYSSCMLCVRMRGVAGSGQDGRGAMAAMALVRLRGTRRLGSIA